MCRRPICLVSLVFVLGLVLADVSNAVDPDLVGWWKLEESGGDLKDSSDKGNDGTFNGSLYQQPGVDGYALGFNGISDRLKCGENGRPSNTFSFGAWIKTTVEHEVDSEADQFGGVAGQHYAVESRFQGANAGAGLSVGTNGIGVYEHGDSYMPGVAIYEGDIGEDWNHIMVVYDNKQPTLYLNGEAVRTGQVSSRPEVIAPRRFGGMAYGYFEGSMDEIQVYSRALTETEIRGMIRSVLGGETAYEPNPTDGQTDVPRDADLSWTPGDLAGTHNVYVGDSLEEVESATVPTAQGLTDTSYDPGRLNFLETVFWRVDEVNATPDNTVFEGEVWSFTVEPKSIPVAVVSATASSFAAPQEPNNTVNGSGLSEADEHGNVLETMWLSDTTDTAAWIQFELEQIEKLDKVHVWNHNTQTEMILGFGIKEALVETSLDGENWTELKTVELPQATGVGTYTGADAALDGVAARFVRLVPLGNYSLLGLTQYGLSEVRFYAIPVTAREPMPADGSTSDSADVILGWRSGREAAEHEVVFSDDEQAVVDGSAVVATVSEASHDLGTLTLATSYFWKINEMNDVGTPPAHEGEVWSFQTPEYLVIDDMEMYKAKEGLFIWEHWIDGFDNPDENGAVVGNDDEAETTIVHGGSQSLPITYNNNAAPLSEATLQIDDQDWLANGGKTLALYFHGTADNTGQLYVKINGEQVDYSGDAADFTQSPWHTWNIDLSMVGGDLTKVTSLTIGMSGGGATGKMYIDDIRLYPVLGEMITPVEPDAASLLAHYTFDGDFSDSAGNNDGTALGDAKIVSDPDRGQVVSLDGDDDAVSVPLLPAGTDVTISMWVNPLDAFTPSDWKSTFASDGWTEGDIHWRILNNRTNGGVNGVAGGDLTGTGVVPYEQWSLVVLTLSPTEFSYWLNGISDITRVLESGPTLQMGEGLIGGWMNGDAIEREWAGTIDDVRIYNRTLSAGEVLWLSGKTAPVDKPL